MTPPARIVFMGSPEFAVPTLRALVDAGFHVVLAVTQPDKPAGRGGKLQPPPVKAAAESLGIEVFQPASMKDEAVQDRLRLAAAELFVIAAYGKILPQAVLDIPKNGCLNVHASLLPKWRGPSPITASILSGDSETGVSIMELVRKMDAGPVISHAAVSIGSEETVASLEPRLAALGARELVRVLPAWLGGSVLPVPQDEALATYCHLVTKQDGFLRAEMRIEDAERAVRAYNPWPGASVVYRGLRLAIWRARVVAGELAIPGTIRIIGKAPAVAFPGGWLALEEIQKPGGTRLLAQQFLAGERGNLADTVGLA